MIVMKFGGTSVESAEAIERVAGIVRERLDRRPVVVVSAMGKTTNKLLAMAGHAVRDERPQAMALWEELRTTHVNVASTVSGTLQQQVEQHFVELQELVRGLSILGELTPRSIDAVSSYGERLSSLLVTALFAARGMPAVHVDAREVIKTAARHTQAPPLLEETYARLATQVAPLAVDAVVVMGGFIGSTLDGITTTLGRGGSDFSASLVGAGIGAEEIQIWTDVDGMLTTDPALLPGVHRVKHISFAEAAELAYFGAKVLHPATVMPAIEKNIPVRIVNSRRPQVDGTRITAQAIPSRNIVKAIACKRGITLVNINSTRMLMATGFLQRIFEIFARLETSVDMVATSEVSVSLTIDNPDRLDEITRELQAFAEVTVERGQAIVCLVGEGIRHTAGVLGRVFRAVADRNIRMVSQGASLLNLSFVVAEEDLRPVVAALHAELFADLDPAVFE